MIKSFFSYLFRVNPGSDFKFYTPLFVISGLLILGSVVFSIYYKRKKQNDIALKRLFRKTSSRLFIFGIIILVLVMTRYEGIPYFSMRIWLYATLIIFLYFIYKTIKAYKIDYPRETENTKNILNKATKEQNKYLPNKKKRK